MYRRRVRRGGGVGGNKHGGVGGDEVAGDQNLAAQAGVDALVDRAGGLGLPVVEQIMRAVNRDRGGGGSDRVTAGRADD